MRNRFVVLILLCVFCIAIYLFSFLGDNFQFALKERFLTLVAIIVVSVSISISTLIFQTITQNKILTPSIIGFDSLYIMIQAFLMFIFGYSNIYIQNPQINFLISIICMIIFTLCFYKILFKENRNIYLILLLGLIFGTFFSSLSLFFEVLIDPDEFIVVQGRMFASFNNINFEILLWSLILLFIVLFFIFKYFKYLDILSLDKDSAISLGVPFYILVKKFMIIISILVSISTALVGPITFLGLLIVNISYQLFNTHRHKILILTGILLSIITLVGGTYLVSKIFEFNTTISVLINFIGGIYFIYLVLKGNKI